MYKPIQAILGLTVYSMRGMKTRKNAKSAPINYILFDDGETFIELEEQDDYTYHDCSSYAREIHVHKDKERWEYINGDEYMDSTEDL